MIKNYDKVKLIKDIYSNNFDKNSLIKKGSTGTIMEINDKYCVVQFDDNSVSFVNIEDIIKV